MLAFEFGPLRADYPPTDELGLVAHVEATFALRVEDDVIFEQPFFPVVELGLALQGWLKGQASERPDFEFESMHVEELGWVWIRREGAGWRVGSILQTRAALTVWSEAEVDRAIASFEDRLATGIESTFGSPASSTFAEVLAREQQSADESP